MINKKLLLGVAASILLFQTGCSMTQNLDVDPRFNNDQAKFFSMSGLTGCLTGAAVGGAAGAAIGKATDTSPLGGLIIGGVVGCLSGMTVNYILDTSRAKHHNAEDQLNDIIGKIKETNQKAQIQKETLTEVYEDDLREIEQIKEDIKTGKKNKSQLKAKAHKMDNNIKLLKEELENGNKLLENFEYARDELKKDKNAQSESVKKQLKDLDGEITRLRTSIEELEYQIDEYQETSVSLLALAD